ncbi:MAG: helix-turn-helix transcriptional regulator [Pyrinomonadaceae bacterium]|nr:helix-turn-helix transcriptional regulator [Pyrinomonadaceae bacterium]
MRFRKLKAGEHFGKTGQKQYFSSAVTSESVYEGKADLPKHYHELGFFTLVLKGNYFDRIHGREEALNPMNVIWRAEGVPHIDRIGRKGGRFFFVEIKPEQLRRLREVEFPPSRFIQETGALTWLIFRLKREAEMADQACDLIIDGLTLEMLGHLLRKSVDGKMPAWLKRVVEKLNDEFTYNISIDELASEAGVHPTTLMRTFRKFRQCSIGGYVQNLRVTAAARRLAQNDVPIAEVALDSGFADQSHLTKIFKRVTGTTPGAFRRNLG